MKFINCPHTYTVSITVNKQIIKEITETKFLGVIIYNKIYWDAH